MTKEEIKSATNEEVVKRLDALIRLVFEISKPEKKRKFGEGDLARLLKSLDLTATEIVKIMGKDAPSDISYALYPKKGKDGSKCIKKPESKVNDDELNSNSKKK